MIERGGERCLGCDEMTGLQVNMAGRGDQVSGAVISRQGLLPDRLRGRKLGAAKGVRGGVVVAGLSVDGGLDGS